MMAVLIPLDWHRKAEYQKNAERLNHIALLTNAQEIPGRDPAHVRDLLKIDAKASGNEQAIDHLIGTQSTESCAERPGATRTTNRDGGRSCRACPTAPAKPTGRRPRHALANQQLVAGKGDEDGSKAKAQALYESALNSYKRVNDYDPAHGSYALCLIDYGTLLAIGETIRRPSSSTRRSARRSSPSTPRGSGRRRPASLVVDSLILENESLRALQRLGRCRRPSGRGRPDRQGGERQRPPRPNLLSTSLPLGLAPHGAARGEPGDRGLQGRRGRLQGSGRRRPARLPIRLFNIRHGLALADRLTGSSEEAYEQYEQIVNEAPGADGQRPQVHAETAAGPRATG